MTLTEAPAGVRRAAVPMTAVEIDDPFWTPRLQTLVRRSLPSQYRELCASGRLAALGIWHGQGPAPTPHIYWDSDVAKWLEAVAYAQRWQPDPELRAQAEAVIRGYRRLQLPDGYVNQAFQSGRIHQRWTDLRDGHELYCAGHLIEAAVAWHEVLGADELLGVALRLAEHIHQRFGPEGEAGIPGHEEIELALMRLAAASGDRRWSELARLFVLRRGQQPQWWLIEHPRHGRNCGTDPQAIGAYYQSDLPVAERCSCDGHAVRMLYLLAGAWDVAEASGDAALRDGCLRSWQNAVERRMYLTGGFGSQHAGERFTADFDLPDREAYAETCAGVAACLMARRLLTSRADAQAGDVLERELYNGVLAGWSLDGEHYFYANPLRSEHRIDGRRKSWVDDPQYSYRRQRWFGTACCPPNVARLYASLGGYVASLAPDGLELHLHLGMRLRDGGWALATDGDFAWRGELGVTIQAAPGGEQCLRLRRPRWSDSVALRCNGQDVAVVERAGYLELRREWRAGDRVELRCAIAPRLVHGDPRISDAAARLAIQRGPFVYCIEDCDHAEGIAALCLLEGELQEEALDELLPGAVAVSAAAERLAADELYAFAPPRAVPARLRAVPYALWAEREAGAMRVWIPRGGGSA